VVSRLLIGLIAMTLGTIAAQISLHKFDGFPAPFMLIPFVGFHRWHADSLPFSKPARIGTGS